MSIKCRICGGKLKKILNYGHHALSGSFVKSKKNFYNEKKYPLNLCFCKSCSHIQIKEIINPKKLFENYLWETGVSKTNLNLIKELVIQLNKIKKINNSSRVLEIASNDGSLLDVIYKKFRSSVIGVDPAKNFKSLYKKKKIKFFCSFFRKNISKKILLKEKKFDFVIARNVIAHVPNPNEIFYETEKLLKDQGIFLLEFPSLHTIFKGLQYDNVFHEHIGYHSLKSIIDLANRNKLELFDYCIVESQGTSLRCFFKKKNKSQIINNVKINKYLMNEKKNKLYDLKTWIKFSLKIKKHSSNLNNYLQMLKKKKYKISAYGASGKGQSLLQFLKINKSTIDYVFDKSKLKLGKFTPGTRIPILPPSKIGEINVDYILLLTWNLKKEIISESNKFIRNGGKFIIPFPKIQTI